MTEPLTTISLESCPSELLPGVHYDGPDEHRQQWNIFTRIYIGPGQNQHKLKALNTLNDIAFGQGIFAALKKEGFPQQQERISFHTDAKDLREERRWRHHLHMFKDALENACSAQSELTRGEAPRAINHVMIASLINQWINLEKTFGLYPPVKLSRKNQDGIINEAREHRRQILHSPEGAVLAGMIRMLNNSLIAGTTYEIYKKLPERLSGRRRHRLDDDNTEAQYNYQDAMITAQQIFDAALFNYDPMHADKAMFSTYLTESLERTLKSKIRRETGKAMLSLDFEYGEGKDEPTMLAKILTNKPSSDPAFADTNRDVRSKTDEILANMSPRDRNIVESFFVINGAESHTLEDLHKIHGITRQRTAQIKDKFVKKLCESHGIPLPERAKAVPAADGILQQKKKLRAYFAVVLGPDFAIKDVSDKTGIEASRVAALLGAQSACNPKTAGALADRVKNALAGFLKSHDMAAGETFAADFDHMRELCGHGVKKGHAEAVAASR